jgi:hypothetical protein
MVQFGAGEQMIRNKLENQFSSPHPLPFTTPIHLHQKDNNNSNNSQSKINGFPTYKNESCTDAQ